MLEGLEHGLAGRIPLLKQPFMENQAGAGADGNPA
jgi:hypothetical protein